LGRIGDIAETIDVRSSRTQLAIGLIAVLVIFIIQQVLLSRAEPDALYMDSLRLLAQLQDWEQGKLSTLAFWGQASAHRGFINQAFLLANVEWFGLDVMLATRLTTLVILVVSVLLVVAWNRDAREQALSTQRPIGMLQLVITLAFAVLCFSWAGVEVLTLDLGLPLWIKNLCFVLFFIGHAWLLSGTCSRAGVLQLALSVAAPLIVLLVGMGWNHAFVLSTALVQLFAFLPQWQQPGRWRGLLPVATLLVSIALYVGSGQVVSTDMDSARISLTSSTALLPFYALGTTFGGHEALLRGGKPYELLLMLGVIVIAAGSIALWSWLRRGAPGSRLPVYLVLYGGLVAVAVAVARGVDGPGAVIASRYYMDFVLLMVGVLWLASREVAAVPRPIHGWANVALAGLLSIVALGHAWTYLHEWRAGPFRALIFDAMNEASLKGVPDEESARLLQSPLADARRGIDVMRERRLALYGAVPAGYCQASKVKYGAGWNNEEPQGRWSTDAAEIFLPRCECSFVADVYLPAQMTSREVRIIGSDGVQRAAHVQPGRSTRIELGPGVAEGGVRMQVSPSTVPSRDLHGSSDQRVLGVMVDSISVVCDGVDG
jgi:hypothetical protein